MKHCAIFINPFADKTIKRERVRCMSEFAHKQGYTISTLIKTPQQLYRFNDQHIDLLIIYSFKSLNENSTETLAVLNKLLVLPSLNLYVFKNKMYAKDADLRINHQFNIIMDVLRLLSNIEIKQHHCEKNGTV